MDRTTSRTRLSRRRFMAFSAATGAMALPGAALAQSAIDQLMNAPTRGNWDDRFDVRGSSARQVASNSPIYSQGTLASMQSAMATYDRIVRNGGWPNVPQSGPLRLGMQSQAVGVLRQRLAIAGDLAESAGRSNAFDTYVESAVERFQARHGLPADGVVGESTFKAMNVSAQVRLGQLRTNYDRVSQMVEETGGQRYVMVNIPAASIEAVENGSVVQRHTAIVGKVDRQTPIVNSRITDLNLNPYWHAPASIVRRDIIPLMRDDPTYLERNDIHIFDGNGNEIPPESIDWSTDEAVGYLFRQEPGANNAMASVKINFPNSHAVYLHDTPQQTLFSELMRFESSGCVRVQNVGDLIVWLARDTQGWNRQRIEDVIARRERKDVPLAEPVPIHLDYVTAWATDPTVVQFRDDIYHRDGVEQLAMSDLTTQPYQGGEENPYVQGDDQVRTQSGAF